MVLYEDLVLYLLSDRCGNRQFNSRLLSPPKGIRLKLMAFGTFFFSKKLNVPFFGSWRVEQVHNTG